MRDAEKTHDQLLNELKLLRQQLQVHQQQTKKSRLFKVMLDASSEAMALSDTQGQIIYANGAHRRLLGYSATDSVNNRDFYSPNALAALSHEIAPVLARGDSWSGELDMKNTAGQNFATWQCIDCIEDQHGNLLFCFHIKNNDSAFGKSSKRGDDSTQLNELRSRVINILTTAKDDNMYTNALKILLDHFQSQFGFFGYIETDGSLVCPSMTKDIWPQCQMDNKTIIFPRTSWSGLWGRVLTERKSFYKNTAHAVPEGHIPLFRSLGAPILYQGELIGSVHLANRPWDYHQGDIEALENILSFIAPLLHARLQLDWEERERRHVQAQLFQCQKMEAIGALAGGIAHDFNNILATILGYTELLLESTSLHGEERDYLDRIYQAGIRAANLVNQILSFSRADTKTEVKPSQVIPLIKETLKMLQATLPATIEIHHDIDPNCRPILVNPTQFHQVLLNLCTNAGQAMQDQRGVLTVTLQEIARSAIPNPSPDLTASDYLELTVSDTGCGMTPEVQEHLFEPFFTTKNPGEGTGLGLSIVHGIVQNAHGAITVDSTPGQGATFRLFFPVAAQVSELPTAEEKAPMALGDAHILIVEDEPALAIFYETYLKTLGYRVTLFNNGIEALATFRAQPDRFDLVFTDQTMPKMTGVQLSKAILSLKPQVPIILATGYSSAVSAQDAAALGIKAFLMKPIKVATLTRTIRNLLKN